MTTEYRVYSGAGGGGGSDGGGTTAPPPVRTPDNLRSKDAFEVILGLGAGEWDSCEQFLIGDTYLTNPDGSTNFEDVSLRFYNGSWDASYEIKPVLGGFARGVTVNVPLSSGVPVVRTTQVADFDFIDIRFVVSALYTQNDSGVYGSSVTLRIEYKPSNSDNWTSVFGDFTISGKTTSNYVKQVRFPVTRINNTYDIRVVKVSPDSTTTDFNSVTFESFQEITAKNYTWPGTAIAHLTGRASEQFTSLPQFSGIYRMAKVRVPTNYNPITATYDGTWDGTFKQAWTDNPAWCLYDYINNPTDGLASYYPVYMDKYSVYEAAKWCDERTSSGKRRYTFNQLIAEPRSGREQAIYMAGVFNAVFFDDQDGTAFLKVDKEEPARHLFTEENTVDGFSYATTDVSTRYNYITVKFVNPDLMWGEDRRRVYNQPDIDANGMVPYDFIAVGCDNADEAIRRAAYKLYTALTETLTVTFKTNRKGMYVAPWDIALICDDTLNYGTSGRILSLDPTRTIVTLRDKVYLEVGTSYKISFDRGGNLIERNLVSPSTGGTLSLTVDSALPEDLPEFCTFSIEGGALGTPKPFRILKILESEGDPDSYTLHGIEVNRAKWDMIDAYPVDAATDTTYVGSGTVVPSPIDVGFKEIYISLLNEFHLQITPVLDRASYRYYTGEFEVWSRRRGTNEGFVQRSLTGGDSIINHPPGWFEFRILPKSTFGGITEIAKAASFYYNVSSQKTFDVPPVSGLELDGQGNNTNFVGKDARFAWRWNSTTGVQLFGNAEDGADSGWLDSYFLGFLVTVYTEDGVVLRTESIQKEAFYVYTHEKNIADGGHRSFKVGVTTRDIFGRSSDEVTLRVSNPAPAVPTGISATPSIGSVIVEFTPEIATDIAGHLIWSSTVPNFTPSSDNLAFDGLSTNVWLDVPGGETRYVRVASYDTFGKDVLNISSEISVTSGKVAADDIAEGIITKSKLFASLAEEIDNNTTQISSVSGKYTVKIDSNGYVAGYGLINEPNEAGEATSEFAIRADKFWVAAPGTANTVIPFIVDNNQVYINGANIATASIGSAAIGSLSASKIAAGRITVNNIELGGSNFKINAGAQQIVVSDGTRNRVVMGGLGSGTYGLNIYDSTGSLIVGTGGVGPALTVTGANIADLSVSTLKLAGNAVTIPVTATSNSSLNLNSNYSTVMSVAYTSAGAPRTIMLGGRVALLAPGGSVSGSNQVGVIQNSVQVYFKLTRNGALLKEWVVKSAIPYCTGAYVENSYYGVSQVQLMYSCVMDDNVAQVVTDNDATAGVVTYTVEAKTSRDTGTITDRWIHILETKR